MTTVPITSSLVREFTQNDMLILPNSPETPYRQREAGEKKAIHYGQLKLLLTEIQFFTMFWDPMTVIKPIVVYAGAAPGIHIPFMSMMFPQLEFHLYDPRPFAIPESDKIHLYPQYFTDDDARTWANRKDIFFISDIRTAAWKEMTREENEKAVIEDMRRQETWYKIIRPVKALLKFRLPYAYEFIPRYFHYLTGHLLKQPWAPQTTTETRLVPHDLVEADYDIVKYGNQMFHHNTVIREETTFLNPFTGDRQPIDPPNLTNDFDSLLETYILIEFLVKMSGKDMANQQNVIGLTRVIMQEITKHQVNKITLGTLRTGPVKSTTKLVEVRR